MVTQLQNPKPMTGSEDHEKVDFKVVEYPKPSTLLDDLVGMMMTSWDGLRGASCASVKCLEKETVLNPREPRMVVPLFWGQGIPL